MVEDDADQVARHRLSEMARMRAETEKLIAQSKALIAGLQQRLETLRQQTLVHEALLEQRRQQQEKKK